MATEQIQILLADDDNDDLFLFREALSELPIFTHLETVHDGEQLMEYLFENVNQLPNILFLDLNMPRKNGFECLTEIKSNDRLKQLPVVMFSTSYPRDSRYENDIINMLYKIGAQNYIRKPTQFSDLKQAINKILLTLKQDTSSKN